MDGGREGGREGAKDGIDSNDLCLCSTTNVHNFDDRKMQ